MNCLTAEMCYGSNNWWDDKFMAKVLNSNTKRNHCLKKNQLSVVVMYVSVREEGDVLYFYIM